MYTIPLLMITKIPSHVNDIYIYICFRAFCTSIDFTQPDECLLDEARKLYT